MQVRWQLTLRRESHLTVILRLPSHLLIKADLGETELASAPRCSCSVEVLADLRRYRFNFATRRFAVIWDGDGAGEGDAFLLAAADILLVSLLPRSIDRCRRDE